MKMLITFSLCLALVGCAAHRVGTPPGQTPAPITTAEQVNFDDAQFSIHLRAIGKTIRAVHDAGFLETEYFGTLTAGEAKIIRLHQTLGPLLKNWPASGPTADTQAKIAAILNEIKSVATAMVNSGTVGVKNPQSQQALTSDINSLIQLSTEIIGLVQAFKPAPAATVFFPCLPSADCLKTEVYHGGV